MKKKLSLKTILIVSIVLGLAGTGTGVMKKMNAKYFKGENAKLESAILEDDRPAIAQSLARGADVNARGPHGITPLMLAVDRLNRSAVTELLARGADPNLKAADGNSAVSLAVENYRQAPDIFFAIMKAGGNPNMRGPDDDPVIMRFIVDHNCEYLGHMKKLGADLDITTRAGDPIITDSGVAADWDIVWCLIELGAKYDYESTSRQPLSEYISTVFPSPDSPIYPYKKKVWQFLHDHGIQLKPLP